MRLPERWRALSDRLAVRWHQAVITARRWKAIALEIDRWLGYQLTRFTGDNSTLQNAAAELQAIESDLQQLDEDVSTVFDGGDDGEGSVLDGLDGGLEDAEALDVAGDDLEVVNTDDSSHEADTDDLDPLGGDQ